MSATSQMAIKKPHTTLPKISQKREEIKLDLFCSQRMILIDIEQKSEQFVAVCAKSKQIEHQFLHQNQFLQRTWILQSFRFFSARETFHLQNFHLDSHFLCHLFARKRIFTTFKWTLNTYLQKYNYESFDLACKVSETVKNCLLHQHCTFLSLQFVFMTLI